MAALLLPLFCIERPVLPHMLAAASCVGVAVYVCTLPPLIVCFYVPLYACSAAAVRVGVAVCVRTLPPPFASDVLVHVQQLLRVWLWM